MNINNSNTESKYFLYIIMCNFKDFHFMKIGRTKCLESRIKNIQTGCPHRINDVFIIISDYEEEIIRLEFYLHYFLRKHKMNNEWYLVTTDLICIFCNELSKINNNEFTFDEIDFISEEINFDSIEILLHNHEYMFFEVRKVKGKYSQIESLDITDFFGKIMNKIYIK